MEMSNLTIANGFQDHFSVEANSNAGVKVSSAHALGDKSLVQVTSTLGSGETDPNLHGISDTISNSASLSDEVKLVLMKHGIQTDNQNLISDLAALASKDKPMTKHAPHAALQIEEKVSQRVSPAVKDPRVSPSVKDPVVNIFLDGDQTVLNLRNVVVAVWKQIPIGFRIEGEIQEIRKFFTMKGVFHLNAHCSPLYENKTVWLVVSKSDATGLDKWKEQVAGFFGSSGLGAGATTLGAHLELGSETFKTIADAVQMVGTNPAVDIDDWAAFALEQWSKSDNQRIKRLRIWWDGLRGSKYIAFLTVSDPVLKGKTGTFARLKCTKNGFGYVIMSDPDPCQTEDVMSTMIGAPHLALMISAMAGF